MGYNWAQLAFVEKWRMKSVRGVLVGMYRPQDTTFFDLRLRPGEGGVGQIPAPVELRLIDAGNLIREKRIGLTDRVAVVVRAVGAAPSEGSGRSAEAERSRRRLEPGTRVAGTVLEVEEDVALLDVGWPVVLQIAEGSGLAPVPGGQLEFAVAETPKGFLVV